MGDEERMYLRSKTDGYLIAYTEDSEDLLANSDLELVTAAEAYPERYMPDHIKKVAAKPAPKPLPLAAGITPETGSEKEADTDPALAKQAAKGWPQ